MKAERTGQTTTLTPELEISAARMDLQCYATRLAGIQAWMRLLAGVPADAPFGFAHTVFLRRGDAMAHRKLAEYEAAGSDLEGARIALAELASPNDHH
jgi:hypothetical protein